MVYLFLVWIDCLSVFVIGSLVECFVDLVVCWVFLDVFSLVFAFRFCWLFGWVLDLFSLVIYVCLL